jgi:hypothetical protein
MVVGYWLLEMASSEILQPKKDRVDGGNREAKKAYCFGSRKKLKIHFKKIIL